MPVLTQDDHAFFQRNGYVVVHDAVPQGNLDAVIAALWSFLEMDPANPEDWYREPLRPNGMVEMYQHQALWNNRQYPRVYEAFAELLGTRRLWVSIDRACLKPPRHPAHPEYDNKGFIHWDADTTRLPMPLAVQGVLCLADTEIDQGGFQCVPELFRNFDAWLRTQPADRDPHAPDLTGLTVEPIPGKAGDLIIWDRLLAHGNGHNVSSRPRLAQYLTMFEAKPETGGGADWGGDREERIRQWQERLAPAARWAPGDPRGWEQQHCEPAELTALGRKLLGLDSWEAD
ncbi:MAG: Protein involved in biosynthesis of mitomycin antibiotics/polyketide fumonisin [Chthonomonadales bacterium]|nr:Protein involved in biosynthesis of mitomycin antibiotics/polyketide fumonisin [Chthonomonadales bacterium]